MSRYYYYEALKNRYRRQPTEMEIQAGGYKKFHMQYLLDQYQEENKFLNHQVEELLRQNSVLRSTKLATEPSQNTHSNQIQQIRERYNKKSRRQQTQKKIERIDHYHHSERIHSPTQKDMLFSFADGERRRSQLNSKHTLGHSKKQTFSAQKPHNKSFTNPEQTTAKRRRQELNHHEHLSQKEEKKHVRHDNSVYLGDKDRHRIMENPPTTQPHRPHPLLQFAFHRDAYLNQKSQTFIDQLSESKIQKDQPIESKLQQGLVRKVIQLGSKSKSRSNSPSPKKKLSDTGLPQYSRNIRNQSPGEAKEISLTAEKGLPQTLNQNTVPEIKSPMKPFEQITLYENDHNKESKFQGVPRCPQCQIQKNQHIHNQHIHSQHIGNPVTPPPKNLNEEIKIQLTDSQIQTPNRIHRAQSNIEYIAPLENRRLIESTHENPHLAYKIEQPRLSNTLKSEGRGKSKKKFLSLIAGNAVGSSKQ